MSIIILFVVFAVLQGLLLWLRKGNDGKIGQGIRNSDWHAWKSAVLDKEQELTDLKQVEPKL